LSNKSNNSKLKTVKLKFILLLTIAFSAFALQAEEPFNWPIKKLDTAREANYLSEIERDIILELNKVRYNPEMYAKLVLSQLDTLYSEKMLNLPDQEPLLTEEGKSAYNDCMEALKWTTALPLLKPSKGMTKACRLLVYDQGSTGNVGHKGSGNSSPVDRAENFGEFEGSYAENIHYGKGDATMIVASLLIDDGVKSRGHRKNILDKSFNYTGVAVGTHKKYNQMCVNTYATIFVDK
jgi:uncharacterized protein YkwD